MNLEYPPSPPLPSPPLPADAEEPLTVSLDQLTPLVLYKDRLLLIGRGPIVTSSIPAVHSLPYIISYESGQRNSLGWMVYIINSVDKTK